MNDDTILAELRAVRDDIGGVADSVNTGFREMAAVYAAHEQKDLERFAALDLKLQPLEAQRTSLKWVTRGALGLVAAGVVDMLFDHLPKWMAHLP